jgi:hypothetical protein
MILIEIREKSRSGVIQVANLNRVASGKFIIFKIPKTFSKPKVLGIYNPHSIQEHMVKFHPPVLVRIRYSPVACGNK